MPEDPLLAIFRFLIDLTVRHGSIFESMAMDLWGTFAKISLTLFLLTSAANRAWRWDKFGKVIATIVMTQALLQFYSTPWPGMGTSFSAMILNWGQEMANTMNAKMYDLVMLRLDTIWLSLQAPSFFGALLAVPVVLSWGIIALAIIFAKFCLMFSIGGGFIAITTLLLVGPIFVCFLALPGFQWMFFNWLKATLQFAFYGVFANAILFVLGSVLIGFIDTAGDKLSGLQMLASLPVLVQYLFIFASGVLVLPPILTSACFSGHTGQVQIGIGR